MLSNEGVASKKVLKKSIDAIVQFLSKRIHHVNFRLPLVGVQQIIENRAMRQAGIDLL
jgi:predicted XRE-type DNA-binding protein